MATTPEEISREYSPVHFEELRQSGYASSAEGSGEAPKRRRTSPRALILSTDLAVLVLSLGHLVLLILLMCYKGRPVDASYGSFQTALTTIGPIFPMVFAFIVSRFLYHAARHRLENGASLGVLEQLMGSRTVGSAVGIHFELCTFNMLGLLILFVWAFSPIGGQSFPRVLHITYPPANTSLFYMNTLNRKYEFGDIPSVSASYISAFFSSYFLQAGPRDLWGNVKIPLLDTSDSDGWHDIDHDTTTYSAFIGLPISNVSVGNSTFEIESIYLELNCDPVTSHKLDKNAHSFSEAETPISALELNYTNTLDGILLPAVRDSIKTLRGMEYGKKQHPFVNGSWYGFQQAEHGRWNIALNRFVNRFWFGAYKTRYAMNRGQGDSFTFHNMGVFENETTIEAGPTQLLFQVRQNFTVFNQTTKKVEVSSVEVQKAKCLVLQKYIESRVTCSRATPESTADCRVKSQRPSQKPHPPENLSILSHPYFFAHLSKGLPTIVEPSPRDPTLWSISGQRRPPGGILEESDFTRSSASQLSHGLTKLINSYMMVWQAGHSLHPLATVSELDVEEKRNSWTWVHVSAETTHLTKLYSISWPWMTACFASCGVLATCGIMGIILAHRGNSPETLGFVSSIVRDSRYIKIPIDVDHMNGEDLSRMLKCERLRYGYIGTESSGSPQMGIGRETETTRIE
ncbi:unnamed protein product [Clonostachys rosea]|uniref:Uncharacterized protein n=1 Tax=Bionectria ochroleuca TaxID=29856 RepID=A0ABY6U462_BIOOC|nr:unnamed protein product [Clonostachys rosea]